MKLLRLLILSLCALCTASWADTFPMPGKPLRIIVPFGAGSGNDLIARAYGRAITDATGITVVVDNRAGAESVIGVDVAKNAAPDGYSVLFGNSSTHVLNGLMLEKIPYDPIGDFVPVAGVSSVSLVLNAGPSTNFKSLKEFLQAAKANPGKYSYGSATTSTRLAMEMFEQLANIKMLAVPYKAMAQAAVALSAGEIDLLITDVATAVPYHQSGRFRPLGATGVKRLAALPDVPTLQEQGVAQYEFTAWSAMFVPAKTPADVTEKLGAIFRQAQTSKYVTEILTLNSQERLEMNSAQLKVMNVKEIERWDAILKRLKTR